MTKRLSPQLFVLVAFSFIYLAACASGVMDVSGAGNIVANNVPEYDIPFDVAH